MQEWKRYEKTQCGILRRRGLIRERLTRSTEWRLLSALGVRPVALSFLCQVWELSAFDLILSHSQKPNDHPSSKALLWCMSCSLFMPVKRMHPVVRDNSPIWHVSRQILFLSQLDSKESLGVLAPLPRIMQSS